MFLAITQEYIRLIITKLHFMCNRITNTTTQEQKVSEAALLAKEAISKEVLGQIQLMK